MFDKLLAVTISRQRAMNNHAIDKSHLNCFDETQNIYTYFVAMYVNNKRFGLNQIHEITEWFFESGLIQKWVTENRVNAGATHIEQIQKLAINHFLVAFFAYSLTFFAAILDLVLEINTHKRMKLQNVGRFWVWMDILHDNERYEYVFGNENRDRNPRFLTKFVIFFYISYLLINYFSLPK